MSVQPASLGLRLLQGFSTLLLGQAAVLAATLLLTPTIIHGLGPDSYGLYVLLAALLNYALLLCGGTMQAAQKYTAEHLGRAEHATLAGMLRRTLAFQACAALAAAAALWLGRGLMTQSWLRLGPGTAELGMRAIGWAAAACLPFFFNQFALNVLYGAQRFRVHAVLVTGQTLLPSAAAAALLWRGSDLPAVAAAFAACQLLLVGPSYWAVRDLLAAPAPVPADRRRAFDAFSWKSLGGQVVWTINYQGDRYFIGLLLPVASVGFYGVASAIAQKFNALCGAVSAAAFPLLTHLHGRGEAERLKRLYLKGTELTLFLILPISILSFVLAPQFMTLWLGQAFSAACTWPSRLLVLANLALVATLLPGAVAAGADHPQLGAYANAARSLLLLVLWPLLIPRWGILGAALGLLVSELLVAPVLVGRVHARFLGVTWGEYWSEACWRPLTAASGLAALGLAVHGRIGGWLELFGFAAAGGALFLVLGYRLLDADARNLLWTWLRDILGRRAHAA